MSRRDSLVGRIAWAAALAAGVAALSAAVATSAISAVLLQEAEDRRLQEAAITLSEELSEGPATQTFVEAIVKDEVEETTHTGILFAVFDADQRLLAGDRRLSAPPAQACVTYGDRLRACHTRDDRGLIAVAASAHARPHGLFLLAACVAAVLAALAAWIASRPLSRAVVAPLARLRAHLARLDVDAGLETSLGVDEQVEEVDALRVTLAQLLTRVNQAIEQARRFAANAAHELRTPLTMIRGELELLSEQPSLSRDDQRNVGRVERKIADLSVLVERLLILAAPKRDAQDAAELLSLRDLVEDTVNTLDPADWERITTDEGDALVRGDSVLLSTVIANALSNGLKFGERVQIEVSHADRWAVIRVSDDGPGVAPEDRLRVFEPFYRAIPNAGAPTAGHGLGLALVRHVAEIHGGAARFIEGRRGWTTLEIRLPA